MPNGADKELLWQPWQQVLGNAYVLYALVVLLIAALSEALYSERPGIAPDEHNRVLQPIEYD
jgi:hypothetical protein